MPKKRTQHSSEYKIEALRRVVDSKEPAASVARSLGLSRETLYRWIREYQANPAEPFPGNGKLTSQDEQIRKLQRENARLTEERDILKKAVTFFAKEPR